MSESQSVKCANGYFCDNGLCIIEKIGQNEEIIDVGRGEGLNCYDGDGGKNYHIRSWVKKGLLTHNDKCINSNTLEEYYCKDDYVVVKVSTSCPEGIEQCDLGRCEKPQEYK